MSDFYQYFKENMESVGLPAPHTLFATLASALATATTILTQIDKFGKKVTIGELIRAGTHLEQLAIVGAYSAAFYVGAVIGSIAVATGRVLGNGTSLADALFSAQRHGVHRDWITDCFHAHPEIYRTELPNRSCFSLAEYRT